MGGSGLRDVGQAFSDVGGKVMIVGAIMVWIALVLELWGASVDHARTAGFNEGYDVGHKGRKRVAPTKGKASSARA